MSDEVTFTIKATMSKRWVPHFLSMLNTMQWFGYIGISRKVSIYSDGDGDFRPKFEHDVKDVQYVEPKMDRKGNVLYDAG